MTQPALFSSGIELVPFVTSAVPLCKSWDVITSRYAGIVSTVGEGLSWKVYKEPDSGLTIVVFEVKQDSSNLQADLIPSSALREKNFHHFEFLCTRKAPHFSVNSTAFSLLHENYEKLDQLKSERWLSKASHMKSTLGSTNKKNVEAILTFDSCFWAHAEEALLSCKELNVVKEKEETLKKLVEFEEYVYGLLKNYAVSPEIFLAQSSYMRWWNEYKAIKGTSYSSTLASFMNDARKREQYALGAYDFP
ncbi:Senescence-associated carboxylesterase 101 [Spatholobus suberectus]|nr:Senescence-associated carboxylesterase 101 [Spatholobus suberectus]